MNRWLRKLWPAPRLTAVHAQRLADWQALPPPDTNARWASARMVVVDVETSGLDATRDRLISIGAVGVHNAAIVPGDSFEVVLRQSAPSADENILVHRIGGTRQCEGEDPCEALLQWLEFARKDPLVAYHAFFDQTMLDRALDGALGAAPEQPWLDVARLAPALCGARVPRAASLDDWLDALEIDTPARHDALADALVTAQLLLVVLDAAATSGLRSIADLMRTDAAQRWFNRG